MANTTARSVSHFPVMGKSTPRFAAPSHTNSYTLVSPGLVNGHPGCMRVWPKHSRAVNYRLKTANSSNNWAAKNSFPSLQLFTGRWAAMNTNQAAVAYKIALAAVSIFLDERRHLGVRNLMNNPQTLPEITAFLDRRLQETYQ